MYDLLELVEALRRKWYQVADDVAASTPDGVEADIPRDVLYGLYSWPSEMSHDDRVAALELAFP